MTHKASDDDENAQGFSKSKIANFLALAGVKANVAKDLANVPDYDPRVTKYMTSKTPFLADFWSEYQPVMYLGSGEFGFVVKAVEVGGRKREVAVKFTKDKPADVRREYENLTHFYRNKLSPKPHKLIFQKPFSIIVMELIAGTLEKFLGSMTPAQCKTVVGAFIKMHGKMYKLGLCHGDLHIGNIAVEDLRSVRFIDTGFASRDKTCGLLDLVQLIRTLDRSFLDIPKITSEDHKQATAYQKLLENNRRAMKVADVKDLQATIRQLKASSMATVLRNMTIIRNTVLAHAKHLYPNAFQTRMTKQSIEELFAYLRDRI